MYSKHASARGRSRSIAHRVCALAGAALWLLAASPAAHGQTAGTRLFADGFNSPLGPNQLITNEYAYWNPNDSLAVRSPSWEMTSGSLFSRSYEGWTGVPDGCSPDRYSTVCTDSAVFRLNTVRKDFGNVKVTMSMRLNGLASTSRTPAVDWDGVHIWLRYQSQYQLYYASVSRRDGHVVIKKKCPGGTENGGTYYTLADKSGLAMPVGSWSKVGAKVTNAADGSVQISLYRNGAWVLRATDTGVGCPAIAAPGAVGIRADNADADFENFVVTAL